jgi:hypothetical protein
MKRYTHAEKVEMMTKVNEAKAQGMNLKQACLKAGMPIHNYKNWQGVLTTAPVTIKVRRQTVSDIILRQVKQNMRQLMEMVQQLEEEVANERA